MLVNIGLLLAGFILLIKGADYFVDGASNLAKLFKIPAVIIGLTIVAFGTSAPEASVSIQAAVNGSNDIALSNVIGSNIFNLSMCLGLASIVTMIPVTRSIIKKDLPFLIIVSTLMAIFSFTGNSIGRIEGIILFALIIAYIVYMIKSVFNKAIDHKEDHEPSLNLFLCILFIGLGLVGIMVGGDFVVTSAKAIALEFGLSEKLVGLTIVSVGTSLPELVTSMVAAKKGQVDIAVGNVFGSNIFNILFILGMTATISPIAVETALFLDLAVMILITLVVFYFSKRQQKFTRNNGIVLVLIFIVYLAYIIIRN